MFIAIDIPAGIKEKIAIFQNELNRLIDAKWVGKDNMHLTLVFLGEIEGERKSAIKEILNELKKFHQFKLKVHGFGGFPDLNRPSVLWIGLEDSEELFKLQKNLVNKLKENGFLIEDRPFVGHLTVARIKSKVNLPKLARFEKKNWGEFKVETIILYQSELKKEGPRHKKCFEIELLPEKF